MNPPDPLPHPLPLVIVPACVNPVGAHANYTAQLKYVDAVATGAHCMPLILPALGAAADLDALLDAVHGVMLTGSPSNVHPGLYGEAAAGEQPFDHARDATTLPLIRAALARGMPLLAICRGFQELNVALGGTLHQAVHHVDGMMDHRENPGHTLARQYAPAHRVLLEAGGRLARLLDGAGAIMVNSLHGQGIAKLAPGLAVEARADDGLVEACSVIDAPGFTMAVQWHPEWLLTENENSMKLFAAFGLACASYRQYKHAKHAKHARPSAGDE
ncbi:gamma-glutamyl-gamma-aminobutyrate hydrolase family protein [Rugamonas sp.]|uniref:gamma-glutamyl-gamma-aminobutyrate hydrolase family protein n=1 Tax=Rugamonas sp. TaxID=1926287 RepID=UPI0025EC3F8F|nr:gamma-glutamyl-gamma-aminobutyrate hydrolase family protein [Rugamonas sp.]